MAAPVSDAPRVRVAALMFLDEKLVLARHKAGSFRYHLLPGGGVGYRETLADAMSREVREETGLEAVAVRPLFVNDTIDPHGSRHVVNITFLAEVVGGSITDSPEDDRVEAVDLVSLSQIDALDLRPPLAPFIKEAVEFGLSDAPTQYLGPLFSEGHKHRFT